MHRRIATFAILAVLLAARCSLPPHPADAAGAAPVVANVVAINGALTVQRPPNSGWFSGFEQMPDYVQDHLKTDANSLAALEFRVGGRIGINKGTEVEIVGPRDVTDVTKRGTVERLVLRSGTIWAKFAKQHEQFKIQTESTVIGIRGTEFVVETDANKDTTVSVLEGQVEYTTGAQKDAEGTGAQANAPGPATGVAGPGTKVTIAYQKVPVVKQYANPDELRKENEQKYPALNNWFVRTVLGAAFSRVPYGGLAFGIVSDPNTAAQQLMNAAVSQATSRVPFGGMIPGISVGGGQKKKEPDFVYGLTPDQKDADPNGLTFNWKPYKDAGEYLLLLSKDEKMDTLDWSTRVKGESAPYPANGMPLMAGQKYFWRLLVLDNEGKPKGKVKASQTWFTVPATYKPASTQ